MPIIFDIENDSLVLEGINRKDKRNAERLLVINKLSVTEIAMVLELPESTIWDIKEQLENRNKQKT